MTDHMKDAEFNPLESPLDLAVQAVLAEPVPEGVAERVNSRATNLDSPTTSLNRPGLLRRVWQAPVARYSSLAAAILLVAGVVSLSLLMDRTASQAFAQMVENIKQADTVQLTFIVKMGRDKEQKTHMVIKGNRVKLEMLGGKWIFVIDEDKKLTLHLDTQHKTARLEEIDEQTAKNASNALAQLRRLQPKDAEKIGEEYLNKRLTHVYRTRTNDFWGMGVTGPMMLWVDPTNGLPVKIVFKPDPKKVLDSPGPNSEVEIWFEDFVWNQPLDDNLFSLNIPEGYEKLESFQVMSAPQSAKRSPRPQSPNP